MFAVKVYIAKYACIIHSQYFRDENIETLERAAEEKQKIIASMKEADESMKDIVSKIAALKVRSVWYFEQKRVRSTLYLFRTTLVVVPIPYYTATFPIHNEVDAKRTECKRLADTCAYFQGVSLRLYYSTVFELSQCVFSVSQRMVYADYVKQGILFYYCSKKNSLQIIRCLAEERYTVSKAGVLKFLCHYRETDTIACAPGTGQASKLTDQICEIIEDKED